MTIFHRYLAHVYIELFKPLIRQNPKIRVNRICYR